MSTKILRKGRLGVVSVKALKIILSITTEEILIFVF